MEREWRENGERMEREWGRGEEGAMGDGREAGRRGGRNPKRSEKWIEREGRSRRGTVKYSRRCAARIHEWQSDGMKRVRGRSWDPQAGRYTHPGGTKQRGVGLQLIRSALNTERAGSPLPVPARPSCSFSRPTHFQRTPLPPLSRHPPILYPHLLNIFMPAFALGVVVLSEGSAAARPPPIGPIGTHPAAAATPREAVPTAPPHRPARRQAAEDQLM